MFVINVLQFVVRMRLMDFPIVKLCAQALNPEIALQLITMDSSLMYDATLTALPVQQVQLLLFLAFLAFFVKMLYTRAALYMSLTKAKL